MSCKKCKIWCWAREPATDGGVTVTNDAADPHAGHAHTGDNANDAPIDLSDHRRRLR